jgi:hypothetical protein
VLTTLFLVLSTAAWGQDPEPSETPPEPLPPAEQPAPEPPPEPESAANPPLREGERPSSEAMGGPRKPGPDPSAKRGRSHRPVCESWEIGVWNPKKSGCAAYPNVIDDQWCRVPEGMIPIEPVGDTYRWWVKRCADPKPEAPSGKR